jgi:hypothetical protein
MLNRRHLFAAGAAVAVIAAPAVAAASQPDAELLELGANYERVVADYRAATARSEATYQDFKAQRPCPPPALIVTRKDAFDFGAFHSQVSRPLTPHGYVHLEKWLTNTGVRSQAASARLEPRVRELLKAYDDHETATQRVLAAVGHKAASDAEDGLYDRLCELERAILAAPCTTLAGLKVKAQVADYNRAPEDHTPNFSEVAAFSVVDLILNGGLN